jgi:hypothetical protein
VYFLVKESGGKPLVHQMRIEKEWSLKHI